MTFASVLRSTLRHDPDVVLVGEIRDSETAKIAVEAATTGHLVLSTLHTNDAPSALTRLTELGVEPFLVGSALNAVIAQRLLRRLCDFCKEEYDPDAELLADSVGFELRGTKKLFRPTEGGCENCRHTGYQGRMALHEVMVVDSDLERAAIARSSSKELRELAKKAGMHTLREDGWDKVRRGETSVDEVLRVAA